MDNRKSSLKFQIIMDLDPLQMYKKSMNKDCLEKEIL